MTFFYEDLNWEVDIKIDVKRDFTSVSIEYVFVNDSEDEDFQIALLPHFHYIPKRLLKNDKKVLVEAALNDGADPKKIWLAEKPAEGINIDSHCFLPIPWSDKSGIIPPGNALKLKLSWLESGPKIENLQLSNQRWTTEFLLPISKLFIPLDLASSYTPTNFIVKYETIDIQITYPIGTRFLSNPEFKNFKPNIKKLTPSISHINEESPFIKVSISPPKKKPFSDITFELPVDLVVPIQLEEYAFKNALTKLRGYTSQVIVSVVDLRGSSNEAEKHRNEPNPVDYTLNFQRLARDTFPDNPSTTHHSNSEMIHMKKVSGDMLMVVASDALAAEVISETIRFTQLLSAEGIPFRAGFHIDQATDTGNAIYSLNEEGTDFLGPALNWAAKIGDDKSNSGIRITKPVVEKALTYLESKFDIESIGFHEKNPSLEVFDLKIRKIHVPDGQQDHLPEFFSCRLSNRIIKLNSRVCVGLDPDLSRYPKALLEEFHLTNINNLAFRDLDRSIIADCILKFNQIVIDIVCNHAVAIKPQSAHYERFGHHGISCLEKTVEYAKNKGLLVILDAKRNDIGTTAQKYALAYLGFDKFTNDAAISFDALTVNPYLGYDGIDPFLLSCKQNGKGIFILVKTSNPSSGDLQDLKLTSNITLAQHLAQKVSTWGESTIGKSGYSSVGAVMGATYPEDIKKLREIMPKAFFLVPGYGAQGASAKDISAAFDENGLGAIINSARGITYCYNTEDEYFSDKIRDQIIIMKDDINSFI